MIRHLSLDKLIKDLSAHIKIFDVATCDKGIVCEVDRIQSTARSIVKRIVKVHGNFKVTSSTKSVTHLGYTKVIIERV